MLLAPATIFSQGLAPKIEAKPEAKPDSKTDTRPAQELYEDANGYLGRRFQEFNKQKLPYDPKADFELLLPLFKAL